MNTDKHGLFRWGETPGEPRWQIIPAREDARPTNDFLLIVSGIRVHPCPFVVKK